MDFALLVLLSAIMLLRPEEIFPELSGAQLYLWTIILTTISALPKLRLLFQPEELSRRSIVVCVCGVFASLCMSAGLSGNMETGWEYIEGFFKSFLYFLLLVSILDTPDRLRHFLGWLVLLVCGVAAVAALNYYEAVEFHSNFPKAIVEKKTDAETGEVTEHRRALASGIFSDPNDLCLILVLGMICCIYQAMSTPAPSARFFWLLPVVPLFLVLAMTGSRGGMLGCLAGFATIMYAYFGFKIGWPLAIAGCLGLLAFAGGRAADLTGGGTARSRVSLWGEGLSSLLNQPASIPFGLGPTWYIDHEGLLAHNSYINAYVELGLIGGGFFLLAFFIALLLTDRMGRMADAPDWVRIMRPAMLGIVVAYAAGCFSLSRHFVLPTYLVLGLASAYINLAGDPPPKHTVSAAWIRWAVPVMVMGLIALKYITEILGRVVY